MSAILLPHARRKRHGLAYTTWNPSDKSASVTLSGGNLIATTSGTDYDLVRSIASKSSGKWQWECGITLVSTGAGIVGLASSGLALSSFPGADASSYGYRSNGNKYNNNNGTSYGASFTTGDVITVLLDLDNGWVFFAKNGTIQNSGNLSTGSGAAFTGVSGTKFAGWSADVGGAGAGNGTSCTVRFDPATFTGLALQSGYAGLAA